jgi:DNA-binding response OmpR family regulator
MLILLAEDDPKISKLLLHLLNKDGYQVDHAVDGGEVLMYHGMNQYEVIILDWMMPIMSGIEACIELRKQKYMGGILMLTAKDSLDDKVTGLEAGADDYLVKPFEYRELLARINALSRRSSKGLHEDLLLAGPFEMNRATKTITYNGSTINLSHREYQLFSLLLENNGKVVPRGTIIDRVWGIDGDVSPNNLDAFIRLLRKKIERPESPRFILNVRGIGYKVEV